MADEGDPAGQGLDALAVAVGEQPVQVHPGPPGGLGLGEVGGEQGGVIAEAGEDARVEVGGGRLQARLETRARPAGADF